MSFFSLEYLNILYDGMQNLSYDKILTNKKE
ncbi:hypothetical protein DTPHA_1402923 [Enterococcus faecium]|nr:hypothetical protein DTPHA_1402923 [Enterococcus faecium]